MIRNDILFELDLCFDLLEGQMGPQQTQEFLSRNYTDPLPTEWKTVLRAQDTLLSDNSRLYRVFWYSGLRNVETMITLVLNLFYLRRHAARLP